MNCAMSVVPGVVAKESGAVRSLAFLTDSIVIATPMRCRDQQRG